MVFEDDPIFGSGEWLAMCLTCWAVGDPEEMNWPMSLPLNGRNRWLIEPEMRQKLIEQQREYFKHEGLELVGGWIR